MFITLFINFAQIARYFDSAGTQTVLDASEDSESHKFGRRWISTKPYDSKCEGSEGDGKTAEANCCTR